MNIGVGMMAVAAVSTARADQAASQPVEVPVITYPLEEMKLEAPGQVQFRLVNGVIEAHQDPQQPYYNPWQDTYFSVIPDPQGQSRVQRFILVRFGQAFSQNYYYSNNMQNQPPPESALELIQVSYTIEEGFRLYASWTNKSVRSFITLDQNARGRVQVLGQLEGQMISAQSSGIWPMLLENPGLWDGPLGQLLESLLGEQMNPWSQGALPWLILADEAVPAGPEVAQWQQWVELLAAPDAAERDTAQRKLQQVGPRLIRFLVALPTATLESEQQERLKQLGETFGINESALAQCREVRHDPLVLLLLMRSPEAHFRRDAFRRLQADLLLQTSFRYDEDEITRRQDWRRVADEVIRLKPDLLKSTGATVTVPANQ
ncbi:MAG: hypothetical protein HJJLKODD_00995 [Phycisphaerae bacterium]|nr:hypothetical protein [Phycisphaerae bacterium]